MSRSTFHSRDNARGDESYLYYSTLRYQKLLSNVKAVLFGSNHVNKIQMGTRSKMSLRQILTDIPSSIRPSRTLSLLVACWVFLLYWGEHWAFLSSVGGCEWESWETWPSDAIPHRMILVADPQLVDPHTYPGRPWPLSSLTVLHTDQYLRRAFTVMQDRLYPHTVHFLGDLFDGGREWSTATSKSPDKQWNKYDDRFWLAEYGRFGSVFLEPWIRYGRREFASGDQKLIATLPGNHDLGISNGVQLPVRDRFWVYFGESNRVELIGNHTFVSIDSVSLTARAQPTEGNHAIWRPTEDFLNHVKELKTAAVGRELRVRFGGPENKLWEHSATDTTEYKGNSPQSTEDSFTLMDIPTVLLSHVPLYRPPGTPCGPLREKWPPSKVAGQTETLQSDDANALRIAAGYQYQNVLHPEVSEDILRKVGGVEHIFSGDDHDYCDILHQGISSGERGAREITVKSISWAMGVREPGFLMISLWNPIDEHGAKLPVSQSPLSKSTLQSHLCLLPNQLTIFIRYGVFLAITLLMLVFRALNIAFWPKKELMTGQSFLPLSRSRSFDIDDGDSYDLDTQFSSSTSHAPGCAGQNGALRSTASRVRSLSLAGKNDVKATRTYQRVEEKSDAYFADAALFRRLGKVDNATKHFLKTFAWSVIQVAVLPLIWYAWLAHMM